MHIDWWTLGLQGINVLILAWIMAHFFYRPVAAIIDQRRLAAAKVLTDAAAMKTSLETEKAAIESTRNGLLAERDRLLTAGRKEIGEERNTMLREASQRIEALRTETGAGLLQQRAAMEQGLAARAATLAVTIAQKLLEKLPADAVAGGFLECLPAQIAALPPKSRQLLAASAETGTLVVSSARALSEAQQRLCQDAIRSTLGSNSRLAFKTDPSLIAGWQLAAGAVVVKNDWQSDLANILEQLKDDVGQR